MVIRSLAPLLQRKERSRRCWPWPRTAARVVLLLGGLAGVNRLAREIGEVLAVAPAITTSGELRFGTCVLNRPPGYVLADLAGRASLPICSVASRCASRCRRLARRGPLATPTRRQRWRFT
ncbi:hypothetical protein P4114_20050 [Pseudomonas aeruginosa]|nr:hypothetical protein [Pseudomonas aeruginosa]